LLDGVIFGLLGAAAEPKAFYTEMQSDEAFLATAWKLGRYYRTYPKYVEDEVRETLRDPADFERGARVLSTRGTDTDDGAAFVVEDDNYVSARWPGDAYLFAKRFAARLGN
jgi:hypothetical protein